ncbi:ABC transporter substrate-binding protein [Saccharibacillus sp. JS10]|uniref:ABC transporter substrate-binding protein n=1 Tax=Saccharibacillus sp. JS10 TaxID=2950552 RepID=UPI00210C02E2|nr:ABC transporter substrate-binding protein [Saccharibacillus sp. JS10]MCQ4085445.1 ABC transporter substrate-binding protein [Saccharibacillus sp. JS10]
MSLTLLAALTAGCSTVSKEPAATGESTPGTAAEQNLDITIGRAFDVSGLDPGFLTENAQVVDNIFDTLVKRDENEKLIPGLATSWKQVDDLTWEFKLREGVSFTNGEPFNAEAVKYSLDRVIDPASNAPTASYVSTIDKVEAIDDYTVHVITKKPDPLIPTRFNRYPTEVVPPKYAEEVGQEEFAQKPIGTGPYKFVSWDKGSNVVLEANADYWNGAPEVKKVTFRSIPEASTRVSALLNGEVDIVTGVSPEDRSKIESSSNARLSTVERAGNTVYVGFKTDVKPFNDPKVRQALNYAIDVDTIVDKVLQGAAVRTNSLIGPKDFGYAGEPEGYNYDPEKAKQLLAEAGYPDGFSITLDTVSWYIKNTDVAQVIAEQLKAVGVTVKVNNVESSVYRTLVPAGKQSDMYVLGWSSTNTLDADAAIYAILRSGESYSTYHNADVDAKLDEARSSTDENKRTELYKEIQDEVIKDAPRIFLYQENQYYGVSDSLNWDGRVDTSIQVSTITAKTQ